MIVVDPLILESCNRCWESCKAETNGKGFYMGVVTFSVPLTGSVYCTSIYGSQQHNQDTIQMLSTYNISNLSEVWISPKWFATHGWPLVECQFNLVIYKHYFCTCSHLLQASMIMLFCPSALYMFLQQNHILELLLIFLETIFNTFSNIHALCILTVQLLCSCYTLLLLWSL